VLIKQPDEQVLQGQMRALTAALVNITVLK